MGYLDSAGLAYFWGKTKTALAGKQNTIAAGDGLSKTGDALSVTTPVRSIVTQAEFDALPEAQQNKGLYVISDGGGGGDSGGVDVESYNTDDGWYVREWSDGYVELFKMIIVEIPLSSWTSWGALYSASLGSVPLPFQLTQKYMEHFLYANYENLEEANRMTLMTAIAQGGNLPDGAYNDRTNYYLAYRPTKPTSDIKSRFNISVTGRWK